MAARKRAADTSIVEIKSNRHIPAMNGLLDKQKENNPGPTKPSMSVVTAAVFSPELLMTFGLIFGGCCSNVYTLESIIALSPATGSLITFLQFFLTSLVNLPWQTVLHRTTNDSPTSSFAYLPRLRKRSVPLYKWLLYTVMFLAVNMLNNAAFNYRISIPLHIILRSAGPVTSMLIGYFFAGRRYHPRKVFAVMLLFVGVVLAALSDAASKGKFSTTTATANASELSDQLPGFALLFTALVISAFMGIYTDVLYKMYGQTTAIASEHLFYSHLLALPYFAAQYKGLYSQYLVMLANVSSPHYSHTVFFHSGLPAPSWFKALASYLPLEYLDSKNYSLVPILLLLANAFTQIICISGVYRLSTLANSLAVSVVLNIRKLVSLLLSIWLFGNRLSPGVTAGAVLVFVGGGLYSLPSGPAGKAKVDDEQSKKDK